MVAATGRMVKSPREDGSSASSDRSARLSVDLSKAWPVLEIDGQRTVERPLGLITAIRAQDRDDPWSAGASVRVRTTADLETFFPRYVAAQFVDALAPLSGSAALGPSVRTFIEARQSLIRVAASAVDTVGIKPWDVPSSVIAALALDACAEGPLPEVGAIASDYVGAYREMLAAAGDARGEDLAPVYNLDVAHNDVRSRARILPLHPLWVEACFAPTGIAFHERLPPVLALYGRGVNVLSAEGEPGYYHDRPATGPSARAIEAAAECAILELASTRGTHVQVDLVDMRFAARVVRAMRESLMGATIRRRVTLRFLASGSRDKIDLFVPIEADVPSRAQGLEWEPSVRPLANGGVNPTIAALWSPHSGRTPNTDITPDTAYERWLVANDVDPRAWSLGVARFEPALADCYVGYAVRGRSAPSASVWLTRQVDGCTVGLRTDRNDGLGAASLAAASDPTVAAEASAVATSSTSVVTRSEEWSASSASGEAPTRVFGRREALASIAQALGCATDDLADPSALFAGLARDILATRGSALRYRMTAEIEALLRPIGGFDIDTGAVVDSIERAVLVGDLVERRDTERGPYLVELASPTLVRSAPGSSDVMVLGRAAETLPESAASSLRLRGVVRHATLDDEGLEQAHFRGANLLDSSEWAGIPPVETADDRLGRTEMRNYRGDLSSFGAFDPRSDSEIYIRRFRDGRLTDILERDRIALGRRAVDYGGAEYRLFRRDGEMVLSASIQSQDAVSIAAACAARVGRYPLKASVSGQVVRAYFPPTRWMERLAATGSRAPLEGALVAYRLEPGVVATMTSALRRSMFCEVVVA